MNRKLIPVIMCGGAGKRLWPLSRQNFPKQFIKVKDKYSFFQQTLLRFKFFELKYKKISKIVILTSENHRFIIEEQIEEINLNIKYEIILEPFIKNTSPSLTLAAYHLMTDYPNHLMFVTPSDHYIKSTAKYIRLLKFILSNYVDNSIFIFGIKPTKPSSQFGYIKYQGTKKIKNVLSFKEKPKLNEAKKLLKNGNYLWNSGIFLLTPNTWCSNLKNVNSTLLNIIYKSLKNISFDKNFIRPDSYYYSLCKENSIDYEVIEKFKQINLTLYVVELDFLWDDLGSYLALKNRLLPKKLNNFGYGNYIIDKESKNNIVINQSARKIIAVGGVDNLIIISTDDAVLVYNQNNPESLKELVDNIEKKFKSFYVNNNLIHRPWGHFTTILDENNFKVKKLYIKSNSKISLQSHKHRNEHWVVVNGKATILKGGKIFVLNVNESIYINKKEKHRISNNTPKPLEIIEVQTGSRLDEEDIIRYSDDYNRK